MPDLGPGLTNKSGLIEDDAVDLLDLLLTISGSIKLLTIGPLAAGLVALGIAFTIPPTFTARTSIISPTSTGGSTASSILESLGPLAGVAGGGLGLKDPSAAITAYLAAEAMRAPYQSPMVGPIIQGLIRQVEMARIDEASDGPFITQVDVAEPPELKSKPKKALIAVLTSLAAGFALLLFIFLKQAIGNGSADPGVASKLKKIKLNRPAFRGG